MGWYMPTTRILQADGGDFTKTINPIKDPVRLATTADITLSGTQSIDGVLATVGDRVLVKDQATGADNGIYLVAVGAWTRDSDAPVSSTDLLFAGVQVYVEEGSVNSSISFTLTTTGAITIGTTALVWSSGASGSIGGSTGAVNDAILTADGTGGATIKSSTVTLTSAGAMVGLDSVVMDSISTAPTTGAGKGALGTRNDNPTVLVFKDSGSTIYNLLAWSPVKRPCRVASTVNLTLTGGSSPSAVDGITTVVNDRILVWNQTVGSDNGVYEVTAQGAGDTSTWARAGCFDDAILDHLEAGLGVYIQEGDLWGRTNFTLVTSGTLVIGTTSQEWIPEGGLARSDASSTEIIASTAFTNGTFIVDDAGFTNMRDHSEIAVYFLPTLLGTNTVVDLVIFWSDDGTTIPFAVDDNLQQTDFDITNQADGSFNPKPYTARLTTVGGELATNKGVHLVFPKGGGACKIGVKGNAADGAFSVRVQRMVS